ncbi:MAG: T9SS C-terminal target domain-containing protein [Bacteroidetes bacterium]|nr:MAG: T9SS C-terminal target domain-containing protein [Bacteroidota bacterium]
MMTKYLAIGLLCVACAVPGMAQEVTGLAGWSIYLDPGHGGSNQNVGAFGYSEAQKVLAVGLHLRDLLLETTDIDTVFMSRTTDRDVSLSQRVDHANRTGASYFHSIHSNAGPPDAAYTLLLWPQLRSGAEASPPGGKRMAELMIPYLTDAMRVPTVGARGECDFYGVESCRSPGSFSSGLRNYKGSRNFVQGFTAMPSSLSEGGFHTNPRQNQLNMNAEWKRLEARALYWAILAFHGASPPAERLLAGVISDIDTGQPINGATVTAGGQTYTTDTWASLFSQYSSDPDQLRNGFYYFEALPAGSLAVRVEREGYLPFDAVVSPADSFFTFLDVALISTRPPGVAAVSPADGAEAVRLIDPIVIDFDRQMDRASVEAAASLVPETPLSFLWSSDRRVTVVPDTLLPLTTYTFTLDGTARGRYGHGFDGAGTGTPGSAFSLTFTTGYPDYQPPAPRASYPRVNARDTELRPPISMVFDEPLNPASVPGRVWLEASATGTRIPGRLDVYAVQEQGIITFFPDDDLDPGTAYSLEVREGIEDRFRNAMTIPRKVRFTTTARPPEITRLDDFEAGVDAWWVPQQSGTTTGIVIDSTNAQPDTTTVLRFDDGRQALRLSYGWDTTAVDWLIRTYLPPDAPANRTFDESYILEAYVFGDGSGNQFRFAVDDRVPATAAGHHEVSPWITIDWLGWKRVSWDLSTGETGQWLGDGVLDGTLRFDSIQLTHVPGAAVYGQLVIDNLQLVRAVTTTAAEPLAETPAAYRLEPGYPNPFNPSTTLRFHLPEATAVTLAIYDVMGRQVATLVQGQFAAGTHAATWDARDAAGRTVSSGIYLARLETPAFRQTRRLLLVK